MTTADLHNIIYILADKASDAINPILVALIAEEPLLMRERLRQKGEITKSIWPETLRFWGRAILCVGVAVVMAEAGKKIQVWPGHNNFPSGHTTFAASAAACLVLRRGNSWLWLAGRLRF